MQLETTTEVKLVDLSAKDWILFQYLPSRYDENAIEDKEKEVISLFEENHSILDCLEKIKSIGEKEYLEFASSFLDLILNGTISSSELSILVNSFEYLGKQKDSSDLEIYNQESAAIWDRASIYLKEKLFEKDIHGNFIHNFQQVIGHEIAHSVIEIIDYYNSPEENSISDIPPLNFNMVSSLIAEANNICPAETLHIKEMIDGGKASNSLIAKERLAEAIGSYICCGGKLENFVELRISLVPNEYLDIKNNGSDTLSKLIEVNKKIFYEIDSLWPNIKQQVALSQALEYDIDESNQNIITTPPLTGNQSNDFSRTPTKSNYQESPSLGKKEAKEDLSFLVKDFLKGLSEGILGIN